MLGCCALFIHLGQWQQGKAERKQTAQAALDAQRSHGRISLPATLIQDAESLRYAPVTVRGEFDPTHQILVDNRVHNEVAGYHVLTPLRIVGTDVRVLINRGWIPAPANHSEVPQVETPRGEVEVTGTAVIPGTRFFELQPPAASNGWATVWQNLSLERFRNAVSWPLQPLVIEVDASAENNAFGFVRDWPRPDDRWEKHMSYALQWYGFAISAVLIWGYLAWRKPA